MTGHAPTSKNMSRLLRRSTNRNALPWLLGAPAFVVVVFLSYLMLRPDPASSQFYRAQKLQAAGQSESSLRLYSLIVSSLPNSSFAPLSLQQQGEILTGMARRSGDASEYREAVAAYARLASEYSSHSLAGEALLAAGSLAANNLRDGKTAAGFYQTLLKNYPGNPDYVSEAVLRLGRIFLQGGAGVQAQNYFARVLKEYSRFPDRCAEAQYQTGVTSETLLKNKAQARAAYEATIKKWPRSVWAASAKERLGMLLYSGSNDNRPSRRVLLEIGPLPETGKSDSRLSALKIILAARGLEASESVLRGWSLLPFRAGFAPENPSRILDDDENFETIAANAGLVFSRKNSDNAAEALNDLRNELDAGHAPLVAIDGWVLVVGYDSSRDEIFTQKPGAERETWAAKEFAIRWRKESDLSFLTFYVAGENVRAVQQSKSEPSAAPDLISPVYLYKLPALSLTNAHRRALRRAAGLMNRTREDGVLLNLEALRELSKELETLAVAPDSPVPSPEPIPEAAATEENGSTPVAAPTPIPPAPDNSALLEQRKKRWKNLRRWFDAPLKNWIETRRDAAAFLEIAGNDLNDSRLQRAAAELREAMVSLQNAGTLIPSANAFDENEDEARTQLEAAAREISAAYEAEKRATTIMAAF